MNTKKTLYLNTSPVGGLRPLFLSLVALAAVSSAGFAQEDQVVYRQTFGTQANDVLFSTVNWQGYYGHDNSLSTIDVDGGGRLGNATGAPVGLENVGTGFDSADTSQGLAYFGSAATDRILAFTEVANNDISVPLNRSTLTSISFYQGNTHPQTAIEYRFALRILDDWYVSDVPAIQEGATFINGVSDFATDAEELKVEEFGLSNWRVLNLDIDMENEMGSIALGATEQALPEGEISAFGVFVYKPNAGSGSGTARFDNYQITAIPEPSLFAVVLGSAALLFVARREK